MKKLNANEMRTVEGGKWYYCDICKESYNCNWGQWLCHKFSSAHLGLKWAKAWSK